MDWKLSLAEIVELTGGGRVVGGFAGEVTEIEDLGQARAGQLSFLKGGKYAKLLERSEASVVLVPEGIAGVPRDGQAWVMLADTSVALASVCAEIERRLNPPVVPGIHGSAAIDETVKLGEGVYIGPNCVVDAGVELGDGVVLQSQVRVCAGAAIGAGSTLMHGVWIAPRTQVGARCLLHPGCVIGAEGFGFHSDASGHHKLPQIGRVIIEDDVEIGANTTIDRARFAATRIGTGTKIDNLVQIGHNVTIGKHCIICASVGMAGSAQLGDFVVLAGQVGVNGHIKIGDGVQAAGQSGITKDIPPRQVISGLPAQTHREELRYQAALRKVPELLNRVRELEQRLKE